MSWLSNEGDQGKKLNVALIQSLILTTKGEDTTKCFLWSVGSITGDPETHFRSRQDTIYGKNLPKWDCTGGCGNAVESETHNTSEGTSYQVRSGVIDQYPLLAQDLETSQAYGVLDEPTSHGTGAVLDHDWDWLTGGIHEFMESARGVGVEGWDGWGASNTTLNRNPQIGRASVKDNFEGLRTVLGLNLERSKMNWLN